MNDAKVVCRQLGFPGAKAALQGRHVPDGTGYIWLDEVACTGNEKILASCPHYGWGTHDCRHYEDAGVHCDMPGKRSLNNIGNAILSVINDTIFSGNEQQKV